MLSLFKMARITTVFYGFSLTYMEVKALFPDYRAENEDDFDDVEDCICWSHGFRYRCPIEITDEIEVVGTDYDGMDDAGIVDDVETVVIGVVVRRLETSYSGVMRFPTITEEHKELLARFIEANPVFRGIEEMAEVLIHSE